MNKQEFANNWLMRNQTENYFTYEGYCKEDRLEMIEEVVALLTDFFVLEIQEYKKWLIERQKYHEELAKSMRDLAAKLNNDSRALAFLEARKELDKGSMTQPSEVTYDILDIENAYQRGATAMRESIAYEANVRELKVFENVINDLPVPKFTQ